MRAGCGIMGVGALWIVGTACGLALIVPLSVILGMAACVLGVGALLRSAGRRATVAALGGVFLVAMANAALHAQRRDRALARLAALPVECLASCTVAGVVPESPEATTTRRGAACVRFELRRATVRTGDGELAVPLPIRVTLFGARGDVPCAGERWALRGRLAVAPDGARGGVAGAGRAGAPHLTARRDDARRLSGGGVLTATLARAREGMAALLSAGIADAPLVTDLVRAMVLGYRADVPAAVSEDFRRTGTMHVFAISGLHVGILCSFVLVALGASRCSRVYWAVGLAPMAFLYAVLTGGRPSAMRACWMAVAYFSAPLLRRRPDVGAALALAALLILARNPFDLIDVGFILSFVVVAGIVLLYPVLERPMRRWWTHDPMLPISTAATWRHGLARYVGGLVCISVAAWLTSTPLTAFYFGRIAPVALLANLFVVPLSFLVLLASALSVVAGSCWAALGEVFNHANLAVVTLQVGLMHGFGMWRFASVEVPPPSPGVVVACYIALVVFGMSARGRLANAEEGR